MTLLLSFLMYFQDNSMTDDEKNNQWPKWSEMDDTGKGITVMFWIFLFALVWSWIG